VTRLAEAFLPLIRTRADLSRWRASDAHSRRMHQAVDILEVAIPTSDRVEVYAVTHKALPARSRSSLRPMTPAGSSVVLAVASSSFIPRLPRQHRCRPAIWSTR
jgi:hypothetical protein